MDLTAIQRLEKARREAKLSPTVRLSGGKKRMASLLKFRISSLKNIRDGGESGQPGAVDSLQQTREQNDNALLPGSSSGISFRDVEMDKISSGYISSVTSSGGMRSALRKTMEPEHAYESTHNQNYHDIFSVIPPSSHANVQSFSSGTSQFNHFSESSQTPVPSHNPLKVHAESSNLKTPTVRFEASPGYSSTLQLESLSSIGQMESRNDTPNNNGVLSYSPLTSATNVYNSVALSRQPASQWEVSGSIQQNQVSYQFNPLNQENGLQQETNHGKTVYNNRNAADMFWAEIDAAHSTVPQKNVGAIQMRPSDNSLQDQYKGSHSQMRSMALPNFTPTHLEKEITQQIKENPVEYREIPSIFKRPGDSNYSKTHISASKVSFNPDPAVVGSYQINSNLHCPNSKIAANGNTCKSMGSSAYVISPAMLQDRRLSLPSPASFGLSQQPQMIHDFQEQVTPVATNVTNSREKDPSNNVSPPEPISGTGTSQYTLDTLSQLKGRNVSLNNISALAQGEVQHIQPQQIFLQSQHSLMQTQESLMQPQYNLMQSTYNLMQPQRNNEMRNSVLETSERNIGAESPSKSGRRKINKWLKNTLATVAANVSRNGSDGVESPTKNGEHHIPIPDLFDDEGDPNSSNVIGGEHKVSSSKRKSRSPHKKSRRSSSERTPSTEIVLRSCEIEPSKHQIQIPGADEFYMHAKICSVMENYSKVFPDFDFSTIVGLSRVALQSKFGPVRAVTPGGSAMTQDPRRPIITSLLACSDDLVVEGFFRPRPMLNEGINNMSLSEISCETSTSGSLDSDIAAASTVDYQDNGVQIAVFSSQNKRQFIVCFRGSDEQQNEPVKGKAKLKEVTGGVSMLHPTQPYAVNPIFRNAYFSHTLETKIFNLLDDLAAKSPFCEVVCTGHSFGAALSTIAATRYAAMYPMMVVSCHAFGSPRVGGIDFRRFVNSLPNLKVRKYFFVFDHDEQIVSYVVC
mmetsp:Transcript_16906/g.38031  ORF Transcript_16906/g.38031 Transcript_16906/m.38031 type:complete len:971 (-) Transcript_16906:620-3532(-)